MILLGDDYDSYQLKLPESYKLNILYWSLQGDKVTKFYEKYKDGFCPFNGYEKNIISLHNKKFKSIKKNVQPFKCFLHIKNKPIKFIAATTDSCINELADHLITKYKSDVGVIINLNTNRFSLRKSRSCDLDLSELINKIGSGGGHEYAAGGMLNDNVISGQTELASGLATTDELLVSDGGTIKRMDVSVLQTVTDDSATALAIALGQGELNGEYI